MTERIRRQNWIFNYDPAKIQKPLKERILDTIESHAVGESVNIKIIL